MKIRMLLSLCLMAAGVLLGLGLAQPAVYAAPAAQTPSPSLVGPPPVVVAMQTAGKVPRVEDTVAPVILGVMDQYNKRLLPWQREEILNEILAASERWGLDPLLVAAVIAAESNFEPNAKSPADARGLMQITRWHAWRCPDRYNVPDNIDTGCWYLALNLERFGGSERLALAAYNAGPGKARWALNHHPETSRHVPKVLRIRDRLVRAQRGRTVEERYCLAAEIRGPAPAGVMAGVFAARLKGART